MTGLDYDDWKAIWGVFLKDLGMALIGGFLVVQIIEPERGNQLPLIIMSCGLLFIGCILVILFGKKQKSSQKKRR